jgi:glycosyltransferase involved in cell wall biosynthesis
MIQKNLVSVIIPSYNAAKFLDETIASVLNQTYQNIEIIVVDDGSQDNTKEVLRKYENKIKYVYQSNQGVSAARNKGFDCSSGDFICFLDADDWFYPTNIQEKVKLIQESGNGLVHSWVEMTDEFLQPISLLKGKSGDCIVNELLNLVPPAIPCPSNVLVRRDVLSRVGLFDPHLSTSADFDLWLRIAREYRVVVFEHPLVKYRTSSQSMFTNIDLLIRDTKYILEKYRKLDEYKKYDWCNFQKRSYYSIAGGLYLRKRYIEFAEFYLKYISYSILKKIR